jgi:hypothetical protein
VNRPRSATAHPAKTTSELAWVLGLWWSTTKRSWRHHTGALLLGLGTTVAIGRASYYAPPGGEPFYLTVVLLLALTALVASPLILFLESVFISRRMDLLPLSNRTRWASRVILSNSLRTVLTFVVIAWGLAVLLGYGPEGWPLVGRFLQLLGFVAAALAFSQLLEDVIRHSRAVVVHQVVFLLIIAFWPVIVDYLRTPSNFVPPPAWTIGPASILLFPAPAPTGALIAAVLAPVLLTLALVRVNAWFLSRYQHRPPSPATSVRWTAAIAAFLAGPAGRGSPLGKELLVPLRFLFLRMTLVFIALTTVAAFVSGVPFLLLAAPFWWQPLSTNALGPDAGDGSLRYSLAGITLASVLRWRLISSMVITLAGFLVVALVSAVAGWVEVPGIGPPARSMYLIVFVYSLSLLPLWAIGGDRYSMRYSDRLEMQTLLPERTRSGRAGAVLLLFFLWVTTILAAGGILLFAAGLVMALWGGPLDLSRVALVSIVAAALNTLAYAFHARAFSPGALDVSRA